MRAMAWVVVCASLASGCVPADGGKLPSTKLLPIQPAVITAGASVDLRVASTAGVRVELAWGQLPSGVTLDPRGWIRGRPDAPGEVARFTLRQRDLQGGVVERSYTLAVGTTAQSLSLASPLPIADGNVLTFDGVSLNAEVEHAFAWDATLDLVWPLEGGATLTGAMLAPVNGELSLVASGAQATGELRLQDAEADPNIDIVVQLSWLQPVDLDLSVLESPDPSASASSAWSFRQELARANAPGPEVVSLAREATPGRYALVATKAAGDTVEVTLWLTIHRRDGTELVQRRVDALFSDTAQAGASVEIGSGRQSYAPLGVVEIGRDGTRRYFPPAASPDPFAVDGALP